MEKFARISTRDIKAGSYVVTTIVMEPDQREAMENAVGAAFVPTAELGLQDGDMFNGSEWTRNVDGVQTALPLDEDDPAVEAILAILEGRA